MAAGVRAGLIAVAATIGVLVAYGLRARSVEAPFLFLGRHLGGFRNGIYPQGTVVLAGFLLHAAWIMAWCIVFALIASRARRAVRISLALLIGAVAYVASSQLMGSALETSGLGGSRWLFLHIIFVLAMYQGTRFARHDE